MSTPLPVNYLTESTKLYFPFNCVRLDLCLIVGKGQRVRYLFGQQKSGAIKRLLLQLRIVKRERKHSDNSKQGNCHKGAAYCVCLCFRGTVVLPVVATCYSLMSLVENSAFEKRSRGRCVNIDREQQHWLLFHVRDKRMAVAYSVPIARNKRTWDGSALKKGEDVSQAARITRLQRLARGATGSTWRREEARSFRSGLNCSPDGKKRESS